jgi:predicted O-methyltransferase YrrM
MLHQKQKGNPMAKNPAVAERIENYVSEFVTRETAVQRRLRDETARLPQHMMQITPDQAQFLGLLVQIVGAKHIIEIGTFTGYSALAMAQALPPGGKLTACDISKEWTDVARRYWRDAGVDDRIDLILAPAQETVAKLLKKDGEGSFDMAFVDADKTGYDAYYEACLRLLRPGGVIAFDNMLWGGAVADPSEQDADTKALRSLNAKIRDDDRVDACLLTVADGIMLVRKR